MVRRTIASTVILVGLHIQAIVAQTSEYTVSEVTVSDFASSVSCDLLQITPTGSRLFFRSPTDDALRELDVNSKAQTVFMSSVSWFSVKATQRMYFADTSGTWGAMNLSPDSAGGNDGTFTGTPIGMGMGTSMGFSVLLTESSGLMTGRYKAFLDSSVTSNPNPLTPVTGFYLQSSSSTKGWGCSDGNIVTFNPLESASLTKLFGTGTPGGSDGDESTGQVPAICNIGMTNNHQHMFIVSEDGNTIRHLNMADSSSDRKITTIAGVHGFAGDEIGTGKSARFNAPKGLGYQRISDQEHRLYVCDSGNSKIKQVDIKMTACTKQRVMLVFDRTFLTKVRHSLDEGDAFLDAFIGKVDFGNVVMGFYNILHHSLSQIVSIDSVNASNQTTWQMLSSKVKGGWKHAQTHFWSLFTTVADEVSEVGTPSYILLITDGQLQFRSNWQRHFQLKERMKSRLGSDAPTVVCVQVRTSETSMFLNRTCDVIIHEGKDGKTLEVQAQDFATSLC